MDGASVPETPIDEDGKAASGEHYVRLDWPVRGVDGQVLAESIPPGVEQRPELDLRLGVPLGVGTHHGAHSGAGRLRVRVRSHRFDRLIGRFGLDSWFCCQAERI
jgi:hypothetical protein